LAEHWRRPGPGITLLGFSLGGCLVIRAAAHEPRAGRVIAFGICTVFFRLSEHFAASGLDAIAANSAHIPAPVVNAAAEAALESDLLAQWALTVGCRVIGTATPPSCCRPGAATAPTTSRPGHPGCPADGEHLRSPRAVPPLSTPVTAQAPSARGRTICVIIAFIADCHHTHNQARDVALMVGFSPKAASSPRFR
jgi:hypothetical protein